MIEKCICKTCGKEYIDNPSLEALSAHMPKSMIDRLKFIPNCNCFELEAKLEAEKKETRTAGVRK